MLVATGGGPVATSVTSSRRWIDPTLAALNGSLNEVEFREDANFGFEVPVAVPGVDPKLLNPRSTWADPEAYDRQAAELVAMFVKNFEQYEPHVGDDVKAAAPHAA